MSLGVWCPVIEEAGPPSDYAAGWRQSGISRPPEITMSELSSGTPGRAPVADGPRASRRSRLQIVLGCIGLALLAIGAFSATATARKEWTPPLELSVTQGPAGQPVADVNFGSEGPIVARVEVVARGRVLWSSPLLRNTAAQSVILPTSLLAPSSRVRLVSSGHTLRQVGG